MGYTVVDPPVGPHHDLAALRAWVAECERQLQADPDDAGWELALAEARRWLAQAEHEQ